jgi:hypothetical protein
MERLETMDMETQLFGDPFGNGPRYRRIKAVLSVLDCSRTSLWRMVTAGTVVTKKVGGIVYIDMASIRCLFASAPSAVRIRSGDVNMAALGFEPEPPEPGPPLELAAISGADLEMALADSETRRGAFEPVAATST